jgi:hypothetical protein
MITSCHRSLYLQEGSLMGPFVIWNVGGERERERENTHNNDDDNNNNKASTTNKPQLSHS